MRGGEIHHQYRAYGKVGNNHDSRVHLQGRWSSLIWFPDLSRWFRIRTGIFALQQMAVFATTAIRHSKKSMAMSILHQKRDVCRLPVNLNSSGVPRPNTAPRSSPDLVLSMPAQAHNRFEKSRYRPDYLPHFAATANNCNLFTLHVISSLYLVPVEPKPPSPRPDVSRESVLIKSTRGYSCKYKLCNAHAGHD